MQVHELKIYPKGRVNVPSGFTRLEIEKGTQKHTITQEMINCSDNDIPEDFGAFYEITKYQIAPETLDFLYALKKDTVIQLILKERTPDILFGNFDYIGYPSSGLNGFSKLYCYIKGTTASFQIYTIASIS